MSYILIQGSIQSLAFIGEKPAISNDGKPGELSKMFLITVLQCFLMQHLTAELMLCHLTKAPYFPYKNKLNMAMALSSLVVSGIWIVSPTFYEANVDLMTLLCIMLVVTVLCQWHFLLNTVSELANALNIQVFRVKKQTKLKEHLLQK